MRITSPPDPIASDATQRAWREARNNRPPLPRTAHSASTPCRDRNFGHRFAAYRADERAVLQTFSFSISLCLLIHGLMQNWELVAFFAALLTLNLLAAHYARQAKASHRFARVLTRIYFSTIRHPATGQAVRRYVRLPLLAFLALLMFSSLRLRIPLGHDRPPLIDPRRLSNHSNWEYLRENHFFRPSPPPDPSP